SLRFLFSSLLSAYGLAEYSGQTAETKAMLLPSGDQMPVAASVAMLVSCRASPPPVLMTQSWLSPERLDSKRICSPSGLQRGCLSFLPAPGLVSCRGSPLSVAASHSVELVLLLGRSTLVMT